MARIRLTQPGREQPVDIDVRSAEHGGRGAYVVELDGECHEIAVDANGPAAGRLRFGGRVMPYYAVVRDARIEVWIAGRVHVFDRVDTGLQRARSAARPPGSADLTAPMPGTILKINATAGDGFAAHDPLIVMESMKMEMTLSAPSAGRVREITCTVGELVEMNAVLARLEPPDDGSVEAS